LELLGKIAQIVGVDIVNFMKILFKTYQVGHLVSDKEFERLKKGFAKVGMELLRECDNPDIVMVKCFSHTWDDVKDSGKPVVMYSIGSEWKAGVDLLPANEPMRELYKNAKAVIHVSSYCKMAVEKIFGTRDRSYVIIPAEEPHLPETYPDFSEKIKCVSTAIWRPIKRPGDLRRVFRFLKMAYPNVELDIYGTPEGPMLDDLSIYHNYHIYVQLSRKEGMPNTVLEALSYGLPCIVTNCGGAKEAVGTAGIVIENDPPDDVMFDLSKIEKVDYKKFKKAFIILINNIDYYRSEVRKRVLTQMNDQIAAEKFKEVFQSL
jgi:glycosyltransferase involved in cell wall biosynthesis